jgi:hypothetical protein
MNILVRYLLNLNKAQNRDGKRKHKTKIRGEQQEPKIKTKRVRVRDE